MKRVIILLLTILIHSFLIAQKEKNKKTEPAISPFTVATDIYSETFDGNKSSRFFVENAQYEFKDEAYQVTSLQPGVVYIETPLPSDFSFKRGQDWIFEMSMKKISGVATSQWGICIFRPSQFSGKQAGYINLWMDKDGAYGTFGHMEFKVKKDFNDMKLVKTGDNLDIYFNGKLMGGGSIAKLPEGRFSISQSEANSSGKLVIQYDDIKYEVTKKDTKPVTKSTDVILAIPDINFKNALIAAGVDKNKDGEIQKNEEALPVKEINVFNSKISSLEGIQYFENITTLNCADNMLTVLDISKNTKLEDLFCKQNKLTVLDISKNTHLQEITCSSNQLTVLDLTANKLLGTIECASNKLTQLTVPNPGILTWLDCRWNKLTVLNVTGSLELTTLKCEENLIKQIIYSSDMIVNESEKEWTKDKTASWVKSKE